MSTIVGFCKASLGSYNPDGVLSWPLTNAPLFVCVGVRLGSLELDNTKV